MGPCLGARTPEIMEGDEFLAPGELCSLLGNYTAGENGSSGCGDAHQKQQFASPHKDPSVYLTPIIIVVGVVGNLLSFLVFCFTHLQRLSSSFYLSSLSLADVGFLASLLVIWLDRLGFRLFTTQEICCQTVNYIQKVCEFLAVWFVVSFTAERYIIVYHPLRKDSFCTRRKAKIITLCLLIYSLTFYVYHFWIYDIIRFGDVSSVCSPTPEMYDVNTALSSIHTLQACVVPSLLIVVLNVRLMIKLHRFQKRLARKPQRTPGVAFPDKHHRKSYIHTSVSTTGSMHITFSARPRHGDAEMSNMGEMASVFGVPGSRDDGSTSQPSARTLQSRSQYRTARMLLIISSVFVLLNLPNHGFRVQGFLRSLLGLSPKQTRSQYIWQEVFQIVYFLNFAINFFVYSACGRQFRTGLRRLCRRWSYNLDKIGRALKECRRLEERKQMMTLDALKPERYV